MYHRSPIVIGEKRYAFCMKINVIQSIHDRSVPNQSTIIVEVENMY